MPRSSDFEYVIVGGGLAAASAVDGIRELDSGGSVLLLTEEAEPPYQRPPLSKEYLQYAEAPRSLLYVKPEGWFEGRAGICIETRQRVLALDPDAMQVTTARGNVFRGRRILLATGGRARMLEVPGADLPGVFVLRTVEDAEAIREAALAGGPAVLIGAGFIGMELAASLTVHGVRSIIVESLDRVWPRVLPPPLATWMRNVYAGRGIGFRLEAAVEAIAGDDRVEAVLVGGERLPCRLVVVGVGMIPNDGLASDAGLAVDEGIRVDEYGETSHVDIYAAGDVARFPDPVFGGTNRVEHWEHAREHGRTVGRNMAGGRQKYDLLSYFFSRVFDVNLNVVGRPSDPEAMARRGEPGCGPCIVFTASHGRLSGAVLLDTPEDLEAARALVRARPGFAGLAPDLEDASVPLASLAESVDLDRTRVRKEGQGQ